MFITLNKSQTGYKASGEAFSGGDFLLLMQRKPIGNVMAPYEPKMRALVRHARLSQMGHWMMGVMRVGSYEITLSGSYGGDGLPCSVPPAVFEQGMDVPQELIDAWNVGGGHNSAGSEASAMRAWAKVNLKELKTDKKGISIPDEMPEIAVDTLYNFVAVRNVNQSGVSYVTVRLESDHDSFREQTPRYLRCVGHVICGSKPPTELQEALIFAHQTGLCNLVNEKLWEKGFTFETFAPGFICVPPTAWVPTILHNAGYYDARKWGSANA